MASYPIWNFVNACIYKSSKSWGARRRASVSVYVGSSASNSHEFVHHATTHREHANGDREYRFFIDGVCVKRAILRKGTSELEYLDPEEA